MKILIVGDFHGKFPDKIIRKIKLENPDYIFSPGDFCGNTELGKLFFKYFYGKNRDTISGKIKKRVAYLEKKSFSAGIFVVRKLSSLDKKTFAVMGNWDPAPYGYDLYGKATNSEDKKLTKKIQVASENVKFIDMQVIEFPELILVGGTSSTAPGILSREKLTYVEEKYGKKEAQNFRRNYLWRKKRYSQLFMEANKIRKKTGKQIIFLTHNCPYNTKLDLIRSKKAQKKVQNQHYGSYLERKIIDKYQPDYVFCGHMHENPGQCRVGKSLIINPGSVMDGKFKALEI